MGRTRPKGACEHGWLPHRCLEGCGKNPSPEERALSTLLEAIDLLAIPVAAEERLKRIGLLLSAKRRFLEARSRS